MNRIILSLTLVLFIISASAQFKKGDILLGGDLSYSSNKASSANIVDEQKVNSGIFNITLGKAIKENTVFGIQLTYQPYYNTSDFGYGRQTTRMDYYGIGIFYRIYKTLGKDFYFFGETGAVYNWSNTSMKDSTGNEISSGTGNGGTIYVTPGIAYKVSKKFYIELSIPEIFTLRYASNNTKTGSVTTEIDKTFAAGLNFNSNPLNNIGLGFRLVL
jgi:hypothetical protein